MRRLKEFELWFEKKKAGYSHAAYYTDKYEEGWKAALEWALSHKKPIKYNDYKFDYIKTDIIEEELKSAKT